MLEDDANDLCLSNSCTEFFCDKKQKHPGLFFFVFFFYACLILAFRWLKMVLLAATSFPCAQRNHSITSLVLIQGLVLARRVPHALFAMFAPRKADAVGVMGV